MCDHKNTARVTAKCSDMIGIQYRNNGVTTETEGKMDDDIGSGDYIEFVWCKDCGQIINKKWKT